MRPFGSQKLDQSLLRRFRQRLDKIKALPSRGPSVRQVTAEPSWYLKGYHVIVGLLDEAVGNHLSNWTAECHSHIEGFYETASVDVPLSYEEKRYNDMVVYVSKLIRHVHPLTEACIESADDYYDKLLVYWITWQTPVILAFNALYHMGLCYTYIEDLVGLLVSASLGWEGWQEVGR